MTLITKHLENKNAPNIQQMESDKRYKDNQTRIMNQNSETMKPIINMKTQLELVRQNKSTLEQTMVNGTSSRRV